MPGSRILTLNPYIIFVRGKKSEVIIDKLSDMYKEINLPEVVAAIITDKGDNYRVKQIQLTEVKSAIISKDRFMRVDFSSHQYRRVAYLGEGFVKVEESEVVIEKELPSEVRKRFQICYNSLDRESKQVLEVSVKSVFK